MEIMFGSEHLKADYINLIRLKILMNGQLFQPAGNKTSLSDNKSYFFI